MNKPKKMAIDLHIHTVASDGRDTAAQVVHKAKELGLSAIAITDHDTLGGLNEAEYEGVKCDIEIIRGCELSVKSERGEVHILAFWIPHEAKPLEEALEILRAHRSSRSIRMVENLQAEGIDIQYDEVLQFCVNDEEYNEYDISNLQNTSSYSIGRPHIAAVLLKKGYVSSISEAFTKYIGNNCPAYSSKKLFEVEDIMNLLRQTECTICLAHPGLIKCDSQWLEDYVIYLKELGLHGIEAYHSAHDKKTTNDLLVLSKKHDLVITGGSDYHGSNKPQIFIGSGKGNLRLGMNILDKLKEHRRQLGYKIF